MKTLNCGRLNNEDDFLQSFDMCCSPPFYQETSQQLPKCVGSSFNYTNKEKRGICKLMDNKRGRSVNLRNIIIKCKD